MAAAPYSIPDIIQIAQISMALSLQDIERKNVYGNQIVDKELPMLLNMEWKTLQWCYDSGYDPDSLDARGAYVYALCIKYLQKALAYLGQQGGVIVNPSTGLASTIEAFLYQAEVGAGGSFPIAIGATQIIIPDDYIMSNSISVVVDTADIVYGNYTDRLSYTVTYSNSQAEINIFNGDPNIGLQEFMIVSIRGFKFVTT